MAHAEKTVWIDRPVGSVFDFVLNGGNNRLWQSSVTDVRPLTKAPYGAGSKFEQGIQGPTGRIAGDYEITESKVLELIRFRVIAGPAHSTGAYRFRSQEARTEVTSMLDYELRDISRSIDSAAAQQLCQEIRQTNDSAEASAYERLSAQERHVLLLVSEGKNDRDIARSMFVGQGTVRNYTFSILSKVMEPIMQRRMNEEVGMLNELKAFLEKHA